MNKIISIFMCLCVHSPVLWGDIRIENLAPDSFVLFQGVDYRFHPCDSGEDCQVDPAQAALNQCDLQSFAPSMALTGADCEGAICKKWKVSTLQNQQISVWARPSITGASDCPGWVIGLGKAGIVGRLRNASDGMDGIPPDASFVIHPNTPGERFDIETLRLTLNYQLALSADDTDIEIVESPVGTVAHRDTGKAGAQFFIDLRDTAHREGSRSLVIQDWHDENGNIQTLAFPPNPNNYQIVRTKTFDIPMRQNGTFELYLSAELTVDTGSFLTPLDSGQQGVGFAWWAIELEMLETGE